MEFNQFKSLGTFVTPEGECILGMAKRSYCKVGFSSGVLEHSLGFEYKKDLNSRRIIIPKSNCHWHRPRIMGMV